MNYIIPQFSVKMLLMKVITIGNATLDIALKSNDFKTKEKILSFSAGSKSYINEARFGLGGGAVNSAFTFAKLGFETDVCFKIGEDFVGETIMSELKKQVFQLCSEKETGRIKISPRVVNNPSSFSVILLPENGDRIILAYHSKDYHKWELKEFPQNVKNSFIFVNTDETLAKTWKTYLNQLKKNKKFIAINPSKPFLKEPQKDVMEILNTANIVILNKEETQLFLNKKITDEKKLMSEFKKVLPKPEILIITMGDKGVILSHNNSIASKKGFLLRTAGFKSKKIEDGTGAGDAFGSAFCSYLLRRGFAESINNEEDIKEAIRRGCANAVSVIEKVGAQNGILDEKDYQNERFSNLKITRA